MLDTARNDLERMRTSPDAWAELAHRPGTEIDPARSRVLWALQYDRRPGDLALIRWLVEQETSARREAPFQGLGEDAELAGFLLAGYRQVADVWRHWALKRANFDTWCGYDVEYLFAAGVQRTLDFVRGSDHPERSDLLQRMLGDDGEPEVSDEELAEWAEHKRAWFPEDPADEDEFTWIDRAERIGELRLARELLDRWAQGRPRNREVLSHLYVRLEGLGDFAAAAAARREGLRYVTTPHDSASAWQQLAGLERRAGDHQASWAALEECRLALDDVPGWTEIGLGRTYVQELFLLAAVARTDLAKVVFAEADRQAGAVPRLPPVTLEAAAEAAVRAGAPDRAAHYRELLGAA